MRVVGYIPMVADLFHVGHVYALQRAKEGCLFLIVGVLTDEAVAEYKSEAPVIPFKQRMAVIEACKYVNYAVPQTTLDPSHNLKLYKADIFFSGGSLEDVEKEALKRIKCEIVQFPYYEGQSTTLIKRRIQQSA